MNRAKPDTREEKIRREMNCIFCKIVAGTVPSQLLYQDEELIAFRDIKPQAPVHVLIVTKAHIISLAHLAESDTPIIGRMAKVASKLAKSEGVLERGYRIVINCGDEGGQQVKHLHMHLLGGRQLSDGMG